MGAEFRISAEDGYINVVLSPGYEIHRAGTQGLSAAIADACVRQGSRRVLIEAKEVRRGGMMDSFALGALMGSVLPGVSFAFCFHGFTPDEQAKFFLDVTANRGVRVEFFREPAKALRWLQREA